MIKKPSRQKIREKKHLKIRNRFSGTAERPRLAVYRSNSHIYAQVIDDVSGSTLVSASTVEKDIRSALKATDNKEAAAYVGDIVAKRAMEPISRRGLRGAFIGRKACCRRRIH